MEKQEVYLRIRIDEKAVANEKGYLFAFANESKDSEQAPDYKSKGVAVWINDKKPRDDQEQQEQQPFKPRQEAPVEAFKPKVIAVRTL